MARIGGNPRLSDHQFQPIGDESLTAHLQVRITASQMAQLKSRPDWASWLRRVLADALAKDAS